jgi:hypothetical protein
VDGVDSFVAVKNCYKSLPREIQKKYRGKFTPIIGELEVRHELINRGFEENGAGN